MIYIYIYIHTVYILLMIPHKLHLNSGHCHFFFPSIFLRPKKSRLWGGAAGHCARRVLQISTWHRWRALFGFSKVETYKLKKSWGFSNKTWMVSIEIVRFAKNMSWKETQNSWMMFMTVFFHIVSLHFRPLFLQISHSLKQTWQWKMDPVFSSISSSKREDFYRDVRENGKG